jgi:RNA polymerase sigma factor (sigma-70 family)
MSRPFLIEKSWLSFYRGMLGSWTKRHSNVQDAEDAVQDAVIGIVKNTQSDIDNPHAYLYQASQNSLHGKARRNHRDQFLSLDELAEEDHPVLADPESSIRAVKLAEAMEKALAELPLKCRQAYIWHRLEGYSQAEIAQRLNLSINSIERYIMQALRHLRESLREFDTSQH